MLTTPDATPSHRRTPARPSHRRRIETLDIDGRLKPVNRTDPAETPVGTIRLEAPQLEAPDIALCDPPIRDRCSPTQVGRPKITTVDGIAEDPELYLPL